MNNEPAIVWMKAPFLRLLPAFAAGIIFHFYLKPNPQLLWIAFAIAIMFLIAVPGLRSWWHFRRGWLTGIFVQILLFAMGGLTLSFRDLSNDPLCISTIYRSEYRIAALIQEPLSKKKGSWKTTATITLSGQNGMPTETKGRVLLYFDKSISTEGIGYGSQIYFSQKLEPILSAGNPGAFDFKRYNFFQGIYFQVFLKANQFLILPERKTKLLPRMLFDIRDKTIAILRKFIQGNREAGLAEALLLGYKDDLDKELVQSYSNTGVVHVIAISGLHLGLIYWLLGLILKPVERMPGGKIVKTIFVITGLWIFALLAGAGPSVLRSALMLTFVVCGENF
ncbi:MAG: ComEC family competence protein, partial [Gemmatimonadaceae bacterium]|nr:ComEC family competence protein [Chitinophagaceae bacterium]